MRLPATHGLPLSPATDTPKARIEHAARELETQFAHMLIKSMRSASMGDPLMGDNSTYRDMHDQQLARSLTRGRGLGLAPMIVRQLERGSGNATDGIEDGGLPLTPPAQAMPLPVGDAPSGLPLPMGLRAAGMGLAPSDHGVSLPAVAPLPLPSPPDAMAGCDPSAPLDCSSPEAFVRSVWPHAQKAAAELGVPARALVAQAALETGWGRRLAGGRDAGSNNLFGIKAGGSWHGARVNAGTHEFVNGVRVSERAQFRAYGSTSESFADYARLLGRDRYADARNTGNDTRRFAQALQRAGYATDPAYAAKIEAIANGPTLNNVIARLPGAPQMTASTGPAPGNRG